MYSGPQGGGLPQPFHTPQSIYTGRRVHCLNNKTNQMSTIITLVKLPCILAVTAGIHTSLTVPGRPPRPNWSPFLVYKERHSRPVCSEFKNLTAMNVGKADQTTYSYLIHLAVIGEVIFWAVGGAEMAVMVSRMISMSSSHTTYAATVLSLSFQVI